MTLFEALVALVILGASAAGFLGVFQSGARSVQSAAEWNRATAVASSALEDAVRSIREGGATTRDPRTDSGARVDVQPWATTLDNVTVSVTLTDGRVLTVQRLVRRR